MASSGFKGGTSHGTSNEHGWKGGQDPACSYDVPATALHFLESDRKNPSFHPNGIQCQLIDVHGEVSHGFIA